MSSQDNFVCKYCGKLYIMRWIKWCKQCQIDNLRNNFKNWTSGNEKIDELIQEMQLKINHFGDIIFEWIPYNQFEDIKEIGRDDSTALYSAIWIDGPLQYDDDDKEWTRESSVGVSLKCLYNSQNITNEFLNEVNSHPINYNNISNDNIPKICGITQNPETKDYILVFRCCYCEYCGKIYTNLRYNICICYMKNDCISGNEKIDKLIQEMQLENIGKYAAFFEWIPYIQFNSIKQIGKDDSTTLLYSAIWMDGPLEYIYEEKSWVSVPNKEVVLKCLYNSQDIINEFLNEHKLHDEYDLLDDIPIIYGITQNPDTNDYIMVLQDGYCKYCGKIYTIEKNKWCTTCQINNLKQNFISWTSGNEKIDELIQEMQLKINDTNDVIVEWIPYNQFIEIKELNKNSSGTLYSAIWMDGPLKYDTSKIMWERVPNKEVVLKCHSQNIINKFLNEIKSYTFCNYFNDGIYGISQDPVIKDYIIVLYIDNYCKTCGEIYIVGRRRWCMLCQVNILKENFARWTSGNEKIDNFIQEMQLKINKFNNTIVEWIPYNQFNYIKEIGKGGFATVYSAIWMDGPLRYDYNKKEYKRKPNEEVALKRLNNSQNITDEFLSEVKNYSINHNEHILQIYGISQNPNTKDYIIVLQYANGGNFDNYINDIINWFWFEKLIALKNIIKGLKKIHGNKMVHRDFHTGNILTSFDLDSCYELSCNTASDIYISDMGLCGEISNIGQTKIYGVMPFVAPEVLKRKPYTQAADIYSFGMIMYFVATTKQPFANCAHDNILALNICNGIRPEINEKEAPKCYIDLMKKCWDSNPDNRPNAIEVSELIELFCKSCNASEDMIEDEKIGKQFEEAEEYRKANLLSVKNSKLTTQHPQAYYTSRLLNPFTKDLSNDTDCLDCMIDD
ncbi:Ste20p [Rhizophagus irregularis DAOM 197198w]|uniref:Ste20p n=2 Tax=Rhizophagus irregularis TaxID=588596 RepID=A0A015KYM2_RHIIW|nr:Ste20p [Rhizophagus irregularis DAOM 197198w]